jgi:hypothetical protein
MRRTSPKSPELSGFTVGLPLALNRAGAQPGPQQKSQQTAGFFILKSKLPILNQI